MRGIRAAIRMHRGPVLVRTGVLLSGKGISAADQVFPKLQSEKPPPGWTRVTKAGAYRLMSAGATLRMEQREGSIRLEVAGHEGPGMPGIEEAVRFYQQRLQPAPHGDIQTKPPSCGQECGGWIPQPPTTAPRMKMSYQCGTSRSGCCPVEKAINRGRSKARSRHLGLWKRSMRVHHRQLSAQAVEMGRLLAHPQAVLDAVRHPSRDRLEGPLYHHLAQQLGWQGAVDVHMMLTRPLGQVREKNA